MSHQRPVYDPVPREGSIPGAGARLYFRDIGQGVPIILLHGGPGFDHGYLLPDMDRLADAFHLIYYDQRGRGKSGENVRPEEVNLRSDIDDLDSVRGYFQFESVTLLGHSWGGLLALEYAIRHPERVSRLILLNTAPASHDDCLLFERERETTAPDAVEILRGLQSRPGFAEGDLEARAAYYHVYFQPTLRSPELLKRLVEHLQVNWTPEGALTARAIGDQLWRETYGPVGYNLLPKLTQLRIPTLILHGDYDFIPVACAAHIAEAISGARLHVVSNCGHFSYMERPDTVREALDEFIQSR